MSAIHTSLRLGSISTSEPTCRAIASGATARWLRSRPTSSRIGATVHLGHPHSIGIKDLAKPDYGDPVPVEADEIPVFWACGVTPQAVIAAAKLPFAITHAPGLMLVTDLRNKQLAVL